MKIYNANKLMYLTMNRIKTRKNNAEMLLEWCVIFNKLVTKIDN